MEMDTMIREEFPKKISEMLTNRQFAFARKLDGRAIVTVVNNDDNPAHVEVNLPVAANKALNLLTLGEESEEDKKASAEARVLKRQAIKDQLGDQAGQLLGAAGEIRQKAENVKNAAGAIDVTGAEIGEQMSQVLQDLGQAMENMNRVYGEFVSACGEGTGISRGPVRACETLEIRDGKLVVDLAANRGVIAYLTNE